MSKYQMQADAESVVILRARLAEREGAVEDYRLHAESLGRLVEKWKRLYERRGDALEGQMDDFNAAQAEVDRLRAALVQWTVSDGLGGVKPHPIAERVLARAGENRMSRRHLGVVGSAPPQTETHRVMVGELPHDDCDVCRLRAENERLRQGRSTPRTSPAAPSDQPDHGSGR